MSVARSSLVRSLQTAARRSPLAAPKAVRAFASESKNLKREIISEKQIPVTAFKPDGANASTGTSQPHHFTIPVGRGEKQAAEPSSAVTPLTPAMYAKLPSTLQKMTVMGKVVIVTGYVQNLALNSLHGHKLTICFHTVVLAD